MDVRKIIRFGKSSFVISLPKSWLKKHNLQKGDLLTLEEGTHQLVIKAREHATPLVLEKKVIQANGKEISRIRSEIIAAYLAGYDIIKIIGMNLKPHAKEIKETLHNLAGIELLEQDNTNILAKTLLNSEEISIPILVRRMDNIIRTMFQNNFEHEPSEVLLERDMDVNRLFYLVHRVMNAALDNPPLLQKLKLTHTGLQKHMKITGYLESIGDYLKRISRNLQRAKVTKEEKEKILDVLKHLYAQYILAMKAYHTENTELAFQVELGYKNSMEKCNAVHNLVTGLPSTELVYNLKSMCAAIKKIVRTLTVEI
ncbi:phosphate uptake regulator PhoU [Candidatus Woesearchaeota archaeon]|nr:phosphate uptake regulator PhoU [Candidatus Woesearchaeota archaeon]